MLSQLCFSLHAVQNYEHNRIKYGFRSDVEKTAAAAAESNSMDMDTNLRMGKIKMSAAMLSPYISVLVRYRVRTEKHVCVCEQRLFIQSVLNYPVR